MKKIYFLIIFALMITAGCKPKVQTESVDLDAVNDSITQLIDKYRDACNSKNINVLTSLASDDGLFCGSDPSELLDKTGFINMWTQAFADTISDYSYDIDLRKIKVTDDGKSAIVVEYINICAWSPKMQIRQTFHFVKTNNNWEIDFNAWGFIAKNEDVGKLNKALE